MKGKRNLYLILAITFFIGIIATFLVDGYIGIYDTFYITTGEHEQKVDPGYWLSHKNGYNYFPKWDQMVHFRYQIDNRRFSSYSTSIVASVWKENEKIFDLFSEDRSIKPFDKVLVNWTLDAEELQSMGFSAGAYTVKIERKEIERKIFVNYLQPA